MERKAAKHVLRDCAYAGARGTIDKNAAKDDQYASAGAHVGLISASEYEVQLVTWYMSIRHPTL